MTGLSYSQRSGEHVQDVGRRTSRGLVIAGSRPPVHGLEVTGGGRRLSYRAGQVVQRRVPGRSESVELVDEPVADGPRRPAAE